MGLIVDIFRGQYDSECNAFYGKKAVTVVNVDGPFEPASNRPAALLIENPAGRMVIVPANSDGSGPIRLGDHCGPMNGGTLASSSDGRWAEATGSAAVHVHDRYETTARYAELSY